MDETEIVSSQEGSFVLATQVVSKDVYPVYVWKLGRQMYMSKTRKIIADVFVRTKNYSLCQAKVKEEVKRDISVSTIKRWLELPDMQAYVGQEFEKEGYWNGMDQKTWNMMMVRHMTGEKVFSAVDLYCMNLIAKYRGWQGQVQHSFNQQINIVQRSWKE